MSIHKWIILISVIFISSCNEKSSKNKGLEQVEYFWTAIKTTANVHNERNAFLDDIVPDQERKLTNDYKIKLQKLLELTADIEKKSNTQISILKNKKTEYSDTKLMNCAINYLSQTKELNLRIEKLLIERKNGQLYENEQEIWSEIQELAHQVTEWELKCKDLLETYYEKHNISEEEVDLIKQKIK